MTEPDAAARAESEPSATFDGVGRVIAIAVVVGLGLVGFARPGSILSGGLAWLAFLLCTASGWGAIVAKLTNVEEPDFGLRAAWGLAAYIAVTGPLVAIGVCSRPVILVLIALGVVMFAWREWTTSTPCVRVVRRGVRWARANQGVATVVIVLGALALLQLAGAVSSLDRNPWDDDIAYTPMIKRLLDAGDLVEPFSFRRLSAYGGQTVLGALGAARGTLANVHLIDRGLCFAVTLLLLLGLARERRTHPMWIALIALVVLLMPDTSINTAAHWSGVAMFVALYRTVTRGDWALVGLVGAATCTLRQNYIVVVVLFVGVVLLSRLFSERRGTSWAAAWAIERPVWLRTVGVAFAAILMWWVAAFVSSRTFLFPVIDGTWNHALSLKPAVMSWAEELQFIVWSCIETTPLVIVPVLFVLLAFATDPRRGRPLRSLFIAGTLGFLALGHSFAGTDPFHIWRYAFGFAIALTIVFALEIGTDQERGPRLVTLGRWLLLASLVLQLLVGRDELPKRFAGLFADLREASALGNHGDPSARAEARRYEAMQAAMPPGARLAVMVDDPAYLDFGRNTIANLDTPGFASPGSQLPAFRGAEPIRSYLVDQGYRYLAFVRPERSRYFYRRAFWLWRLFNDGELFAAMSAYAIDTIESFTELATTSTVLYDIDGLVVLELDVPVTTGTTLPGAGDEAARRAAFIRALADREELHDAWSLTTRDDIRFEDGIGALKFVDAGVDDPTWFEIVRPRSTEALRGTPIRPLFRRAHLRIRGTGAMRLVMRAAIALNQTYTRPRLDLSIDGDPLTSVVADERGHYAIDVVVPADRLGGGWHDLYLVLSTSNEPEKDARDLRVGRLELVEWTAVP